ncbi:hypothetical protein Trydic_g534 [Trypoxylus dichotomus]
MVSFPFCLAQFLRCGTAAAAVSPFIDEQFQVCTYLFSAMRSVACKDGEKRRIRDDRDGRWSQECLDREKTRAGKNGRMQSCIFEKCSDLFGRAEFVIRLRAMKLKMEKDYVRRIA